MDAVFQFTNCVQPPANLLFDRGSRLYLNAVSSQTNEKVTVVARLMMPNGKVQSFPRTISLVSGAAATFVTDELPQGFLLSCSLECTVATRRGQTYARVSVYMQDQSFLHVLKAGYITQEKPVSYPPIEVEDPYTGYGNVKEGTLAWSGSQATLTVPANRIWKFLAARFQLQTDATGANRWANIFFTLDTASATIVAPSSQPASLTYIYSFLPIGYNQAVTGASNYVMIGTPELVLPAAFNVDFSISNLQLTDTPGTIYYRVEEFLSP